MLQYLINTEKMFSTINRENNSKMIGHRRHQNCYIYFFLKFLVEYPALNWKKLLVMLFAVEKKMIEQSGYPMVIVFLYLFLLIKIYVIHFGVFAVIYFSSKRNYIGFLM